MQRMWNREQGGCQGATGSSPGSAASAAPRGDSGAALALEAAAPQASAGSASDGGRAGARRSTASVIAQMPVPASAPLAVEPKAVPAPALAPQSPKKGVASAPESKPARPDRWQDMKEATARCRRENPVSRTVCEQHVLFLYCDGYWGRMPQCPEAQNPDPRK